ncbi:helix-turn-helix transcriptional regulator, partial [Flavobacterium filum]|uniref:helix-turn-helix domain-containing protein n=1 Tax=Flavobacterium filum TaxID=370974 RepID=UPI0023F31032
QEDISAKLGITQSAYSKIELGQVDLPYSKLEEIASLLSVPLENIIGFSDSIIFNMKNNKKANGLVIHQIPQTERKLYEELIESLRKENTYLKTTIDKLIAKNK